VSGSPGEQYAFRDNGGSVLAVAHCDCCSGLPQHFSTASLTDETLVFCPQLDDRLGVYTLLDMLPNLGVKVDVLLTQNEEIGRSTAGLFSSGKEYNWIAGFDRRGTGAVMYHYEFRQAHKFFRIERGSYSDISLLGHLGAQALNVGVGYYQEHTSRCYFVVEEYLSQIGQFAQMWEALHGQRFYHQERWPSRREMGWTIDNRWPDENMVDDAVYACKHCMAVFSGCDTITSGRCVACPDCGAGLDKDEAEEMYAWKSGGMDA